MRILYVTNYQGGTVIRQRGQKKNRALGASRKVELLARGLGELGHEVHVVSAGTVREVTCRLYPGFECQEPECGTARVTYLAALDAPRLNLFFAAAMLRRFLGSAGPYDVVILYNLEWYILKPVADFARAQRVPLVIEYEDDALTDTGVRMQGWSRTRGRRAIEHARNEARGVLAVSPELARQIGLENTVVLHGVVGADLLGIPRPGSPVAPIRVVYTGGISREKGPHLLVAAADLVQRPIEMDVVGTGVGLPALRVQARSVETRVTVHGEVSRARLVEILASAHLAVNPHRMPAERLGQIFPFKMLDYLGAGLPVVSSPLGEHPAALDEAIVTYEGERPELVAAAIRRAVDDMGPLSVAADRAREWVANEYSARAAAAKAEAVLVRAAAQTRASVRGVTGLDWRMPKASWRDRYLDRFYRGRPGWTDGTTEFWGLCKAWIAPGARILEIGSGPTNRTTEFLATIGDVTGADVDPDVRANAHLAQVKLIRDGKLPIPDAAFDACVSNYVLEHVPDAALHLSEVARVLRPGGCYVFRTPNRWHYVALVARATPHWFHELVANRLRKLPESAHDPYPTVYALNSRRILQRYAREAGLVVRELRAVEKEPSYGMISPVAFLALMAYERFVNSTGALADLRANLFGVAQKPTAEPTS